MLLHLPACHTLKCGTPAARLRVHVHTVRCGAAQVLNFGEYTLSDAAEPLELYLALECSHLARLALAPPLTACAQHSVGLLAAPVNSATIAFNLVVGLQGLLAYNVELAKASLAVLRAWMLPSLMKHGAAHPRMHIACNLHARPLQ